ncbi:hypothetical protein V496_02341 [Pseudogymnoascus sp. VKM F-4515 (FW-2607)]|nr:hypothetical protein V496_02341 [Pseudogymnoascus sp. VKM F-4515 (FW-2607)]
MATTPTRSDAPNTSSPTISGIERRERRERSRSQLSLRRDKPQLSCNLCRKRKVRCDRQSPCSTCSRRGIARSCVYSGDTRENVLPQLTGTVHERIHQLENLVISLMRHDAAVPVSPGDILISDPPNGTLRMNRHGFEGSGLESPLTPRASAISAVEVGESANTSSMPLGGGYMKYNNIGTANYVGGSHWAAVLESILELKGNLEQEEEIHNMAMDINPHNYVYSNSPWLLYGYQRATRAEILSSIPTRRAADRLVSRYLTLDIPAGVIHRGHFLTEYDNFWKDPPGTPIMWICLLFTILCLGELHQHSQTPTGSTPQISMFDGSPTSSMNIFRERIVQCLMLDKYTKGGPYVVESLIQYNMIEHFLRRDAQFEIWILLGMLIPISLRMGLHRDPKHFTEIPAFAGEMRRRVWATIFQIDVGFSALAGLPRMIKPQQCDTEEPRNLLDSDFDDKTLELPQSRPESEVTPVLFLLAKNRIISVGGLISDLAHDIRPYPYAELMRFETLLQNTQNSLPTSLRWQPLSQSITQSPQTIMQRVYLDMFSYKMLIILYKRYLSASITQPQYTHAREACLDSARNILEYQHLLYEETQPDGRLSSIGWSYSLILNDDFMLAASVLCFYIKQYSKDQRDVIDEETFQTIKSLLRRSHDIWLRSSSVSNEAQKAVQALGIILGIHHPSEDGEIANQLFGGSEDLFVQFNNLASWPVYQELSSPQIIYHAPTWPPFNPIE